MVLIITPNFRLVSGKHYNGYSSTNRAGVYNEAAVGAFPAFLSMLPADMMNESASAEILISTPALQQTFTPVHLNFNDEWTPLALAIQRSRDHGIPAYHKALNLCESRFGLPKGSRISFDDLVHIGITDAKRKTLEGIYMDADDIDLLTGALMESPAPGTVFGSTLTCLLAIQFSNLRNSDRFWYENDLPPSSLNLDQLQAVRRVSLAGLLCQTNEIKKSQPKAFIREDPYLNARLNCEQLAGLDLTSWKTNEQEDVEENLNISAAPDVPELEELSAELVHEAVAKAKVELMARKRMEYESWLAREYIFVEVKGIFKFFIICFLIF